MINKERSKSAVVERMGSSAAFAWQLCAVASGNFRNILARARALQLQSWLYLNEGNMNIAGLTVVIKSDLGNGCQLLLISLEHTLLLGIVLASGKSFSTDITLRLNPSLPKELQGESR
ncbi:hypothetical protein [uncultured Nostoc sp.]|uniref:hypothetical protein n=1 Tax=uncultured Nostoc sp. TaxID=340711 RepID=UPI0035CB74EE